MKKRLVSALLITFAVGIGALSEFGLARSGKTSPSIQQCGCSDILRDGVFQKFQSLNSSNYKRRLLTSILSYREQQSSDPQNAEANAVVPIDGYPVPVGGKEASDHLRALKQKYESSQQLELEQNDVDWLETRLASPEIVKAWSKCMSECNGQRGLKAEIESIGSQAFVLKTRWDGSLGVSSVKIKNFVVFGAKCDPVILVVGKEVGSEWVSQPCVRDGNQGVLVTLNVVDGNGRDAGTQTPNLPEIVINVPQPDLLRNLQQEVKDWRTFVWQGDWPRHQTLMEVSDVIPELKGKRIKYNITVDSYYNQHTYFYRHKIFVNDQEKGVLQSNNYPNPRPIGDDIKSFEGELLVPNDGKVNIKVECVSFDNTIRQVDFDIVNSFIKSQLK